MAEHSAGFKIYADSTQFERGMAQVTRTAGEVGKKVANAFDGRAIGRTLATALGLSLTDIADKVARFWTGFSKDAEAALEAMVMATGKAADAQERALEKLRALKEKEADAAADRATKEYELIRDFRRKAMEEDAAAAAKQNQDAQMAALDKKLAGELAIKEARIAQAEALQKAFELAQEEVRLAEERYEAERKISQELWRQNEIKTVGAGDKDLTDRELARKAMELNKQILGSQLQDMAGGYDWTGKNFNATGFLAKQALSDLTREQDMRRSTRSLASSLGEDAAFMLSGLSESRFREILSGSRDDNKRQTDALETIAAAVRNGMPVVNLNL